eukprot:5465060-Prymnesium_polylepis.1
MSKPFFAGATSGGLRIGIPSTPRQMCRGSRGLHGAWIVKRSERSRSICLYTGPSASCFA